MKNARRTIVDEAEKGEVHQVVRHGDELNPEASVGFNVIGVDTAYVLTDMRIARSTMLREVIHLRQ